MKMAPHPALAHRQGLPCRRCGRGGDRRDAGAGQGRRREGQGRLRGAAGGRRSGQGAGRRARRKSTRSRRNNTIYQWHLGDAKRGRCRLQVGQARHQARHRQQPAGAERDGAARGDRRIRRRQRQLHACGTRRRIRMSRGWSSRLSSAWRPSTSLRVIAPDVGGGFGSKIFIYPEEVVALWASKRVGRPGEMGLRPLRSVPLPTRTAAITSRMPRWRSTPSGKILGAARQDHRQSRRLHVDLLVVGADLSLRHAAVGPVRHPGDLLRGRRGLHQHRAGRCLSRRRAAGSDLRGRAAGRGRRRASWASIRPICASKNFIKTFPHQTPVIMTYDAGDYDASLKKALEIADYKGFGKRKRESARHGKLRGIGFSTYIEACGIAPSQAVGSLGGGVGLWESAEVRVNPTGSVEVLTGCHAHGQGHETTFAQLVSERLGIPIENVSRRARRHRQGAVRHGHLRLALRRGRHVGDGQGARQGRGQGQEGRRPHAGSRRRRHRVQGRQVHRRRHRQVASPGATSRSTPISRTSSPARSWSRD